MLTYPSIEESEKSNELLGLHGYWTELQAIRNKRDVAAPFFTMKRFCKYLEVVATKILTEKKKGEPSKTSLTFDTIGLELNGEDLILDIKKGQAGYKVKYLLHTFNSFQNPYRFLENLLKTPGKDFSPADFEMKSNSCSNLLSRANLKGCLKDIFFKKGNEKNTVQLKSSWIRISEQPLETRLSVQKQFKEMNLPIYNKSS